LAFDHKRFFGISEGRLLHAEKTKENKQGVFHNQRYALLVAWCEAVLAASKAEGTQGNSEGNQTIHGV